MRLIDRLLDPHWEPEADAWCSRHPRLCLLAHLLAAILLVGLLFLLIAGTARADVGLAIVSTDPNCAGKAVVDCQPAQVFKVPASGDVVRISKTDSATWDQNHTWTTFDALVVGQKIEACKQDIPPGPMGPNGAPCADFGFVVAKVAAPTPAAPPVAAGQAVLTWDPVTVDVNGAAISGVTYNVYDNGARVASGIPATTYTLTGIAPGMHVLEYSASDTAGEGARSPKLNFTQPAAAPAVPAAPANPLRVTALAAYDLVKANDSLTVKQIGTVPAGTACISSIQALGYYGVPRAKVALQATATRPAVVLAKCG